MRKTLSLLLAASLTLAACGTVRDSRINPFNWFGKSRSVPLEQTENTNPLIPKTGGLFARDREKTATYAGLPFEQITDLKILRVPGGAIIQATGLAARQGIYSVRLTPANDTEAPVDGVLTYRLEGVRPARATPVGAVPTREVTAGRRLTDQMLRGVRSIRVEGRENARVVRR
jgi:hypothetical protein